MNVRLSSLFKWILLTTLYQSALSQDAPAPVRSAGVVRQRGSLGKAFVGSVEPVRRSVVGTAVAGRIESVYVETGDMIGDAGALAQLRLKAVRLKLAAAEADLQASRHALAELQAGPRDEEIRRLDALVKAAKATFEYANKHLDRLTDLSARGATSQVLLDEGLSAKLAAEQRHIAAQAEYEAALAGTRNEQIAQASAIAAKAEVERDRIQDELNEHTIVAPYRGYVVNRFAETGEWVRIGDPIAEIIEMNPAEIQVSVPGNYISQVKRDMQVRLEIEAVRTATSKVGVLTGTIFRVVPDADSRTRSFPVRIRVENPTHKGQSSLKPGMLARVFLPIGAETDVLAVPPDALVLDRDRAYLFVLKRHSGTTTVRRVEVEAGATQGKLIQIRPVDVKQLPPNCQVVIEGNERLTTGQAVTVLTD